MAHIIDAIVRLKDSFTGPMGKVIESTAKSQRQLNRMSKDIQRTGRNMTRFGGNLTKTVTLPIVGIGIAAAKLGMDFEASMSNVSALSGATGNSLKELETKAREMGAKTSKTAKDAADAMGYMALAGWKQKEIIGGIEPVLRLAEAGNMDLARASSLTTDSLSTMGLTVKDLPHYLDVVAQTARSSNTDIDQMAQAYIGVGGVLKSLNVPLEESAVHLGVLANRGVKGSEAGTALNAVMMNLTAPMGRAKKALGALNLSAFDSQGKFKGMTNVLLELQKKTSGMTEQQRNMYLSMIGGKEHVKNLNALMSGLDGDLEKLTKSIGGADGALMDMAETMQKNNKGSITRLSSALQELGLKIYDNLKPTIASIVGWLERMTATLNGMSPETQQMVVKILAIAAAAGPTILIIGKMVMGVGKAIKIFTAFSAAISKVGLIGAIATPGVIVVAIIAAIIAAGILLWKNWGKITAWFKKTFPGLAANVSKYGANIMSVFKLAGAIAGGVLKAVIWAFQAAWDMIKGVLQVGVEFIAGYVGNLMRIFSGIIDFVAGVFTGNWSRAWQGIKDIFGGYFGALASVAKTPLNLIIAMVNGVIKGLNKIKLPDWVPAIGGKGINIPLIPKLAKGTLNWPGGIAQVHERGGEIIDLPRGSRVYPHDESVRMARKEGGGQTININFGDVTVREEADIQRLAQAFSQKLKEAQLNYGGAW